MFYIGAHSTLSIDDGYLGSGTRLKRAIKHYGKDNFKRDIISFYDSREELMDAEANIVDEGFLKSDDVYNLSTGGGGAYSSNSRKSLSMNKEEKSRVDYSSLEKENRMLQQQLKGLHLRVGDMINTIEDLRNDKERLYEDKNYYQNLVKIFINQK